MQRGARAVSRLEVFSALRRCLRAAGKCPDAGQREVMRDTVRLRFARERALPAGSVRARSCLEEALEEADTLERFIAVKQEDDARRKAVARAGPPPGLSTAPGAVPTGAPVPASGAPRSSTPPPRPVPLNDLFSCARTRTPAPTPTRTPAPARLAASTPGPAPAPASRVAAETTAGASPSGAPQGGHTPRSPAAASVTLMVPPSSSLNLAYFCQLLAPFGEVESVRIDRSRGEVVATFRHEHERLACRHGFPVLVPRAPQ
jgi:hypothetical protein